MNDSLKDILSILHVNRHLNEQEMYRAMSLIMQGEATQAQIGAFLMGLSQTGETVEQIYAAAQVLREKVTPLTPQFDTFDCCGTGGDGAHTYNVSTAVAFVAAACGLYISKHGNRASSSKCGAADVLEACQIDLTDDINLLEEAIDKTGFCFLMAPHHHAAMKHLKDARKELGFKTIANLLGPLANPAGAQYQLLGVYDKKWLRPMAEVLQKLGCKGAWVVCGHDGLDEITVTTKTDIAILENDQITEKTISPQDFGLQISTMDMLRGGDAATNAAALNELLNGEKSAYRDIVIINCSALLCIDDPSLDYEIAAKIAAEAIDTGKAQKVMNDYRALVKQH